MDCRDSLDEKILGLYEESHHVAYVAQQMLSEKYNLNTTREIIMRVWKKENKKVMSYPDALKEAIKKYYVSTPGNMDQILGAINRNTPLRIGYEALRNNLSKLGLKIVPRNILQVQAERNIKRKKSKIKKSMSEYLDRYKFGIIPEAIG